MDYITRFLMISTPFLQQPASLHLAAAPEAEHLFFEQARKPDKL